jgi:hypothetical protein
MQKEIRKQGTDHPSLRGPFIPMNQAAIFQLHRGLQPSFDVEKHPFAIGMFPCRPQQKLMVNIVKETLDVEVKNPVVSPAPLTCNPYGLYRRLPWPIPIGNTLPKSAPGIV